jgi:hypothetical protein
LSGCAIVTSDGPLFDAADAKGAPVLRPGLWTMPDKTECEFDAKAPAAAWPKCANATLVGAGSFVQVVSQVAEKEEKAAKDDKAATDGEATDGASTRDPKAAETTPTDTTPKKPQTMRYILDTGAPVVMQMQRPDDETEGPPFVYAGLRVTATDEQKRATELKVWLALCAKPLSLDKELKPKSGKLLPGLAMRKDSRMECVATTKKPVRNAVKQSEAWVAGGDAKDLSLRARWVRDGDS